MRITGKIIRFDDIRGYGFIAPDVGGEDVFLHANDLDLDRAQVTPGARVSFEIEDGPRGKFATGVRLSVKAPAHPDDHDSESELVSDEYSDVLSVEEVKHVVTELLLGITPTLTGEQIKQVRMAFQTLAQKHGWVEP